MFLDNIYLALLLPLWIFLIVMVGRFFSVYVNKIVIYVLTLLSSAFGAILCGGALWRLPPDKILDTGFPFIKINDFIIDIGLHIDKTGLVFALVLFLVSFLVQMFSISYMKNEKKTYRFYAFMNLFNFAMASLFFSPNLFQMYFFWEVVGVISYLLIGFEYNKEDKSIASKKVFIMNRVGDVALIGAIIMSSYFIYSYAPNKSLATLSFIDMNTISTLTYAYASEPLFEIICVMFMIGALVKSAQFPFYTWLQDAMEAKLPVSALLHSATLVAAGLFLTLRLLPFYTLEPVLLKTLAIVALITVVLCSLSACAQEKPKKVLAYSTSAQFGLMYFALAMLNIKAVFVLFIAHAFIKALLFITLPKENEKWNYIKFIAFLISGLSLSGIVFSGMVAKEMLVLNLDNYHVTILSLISFFTAFYIIKIALDIYDSNGAEKTKLPVLEMLSIFGLLFLNVAFYIYLYKTAKYEVGELFWAAIISWICVYVLYIKKAFWKVPILYPITFNGFYLDDFYTKACSKIYGWFAKLCGLFDTKVLSNYSFCINSAKLGVKVLSFVENKIMNGSVNLITRIFKKISLIDLRAQNGDIQRYNAYAFMIVTAIITFLILGYSAMLIYIGG